MGLFVLAGCGSTFVDARAYGQACTEVSDCVAVDQDACCGGCRCSNFGVIHKDALNRFMRDRAAIACVHGAQLLCFDVPPPVACTAGQCTLVR